MPAPAIRLATITDAPALAALARTSFVAAYGHLTDPDNLAAHLAREYGDAIQAAQLADPTISVWVAEAETVLCAFAQMRRRRPPPPALHGRRGIELWRFYCAPDWVGRGVAGPLMQRVLDAARGEGAEAVWLSVYRHAPRAIAFYRKHGFEIVGETTYRYGSKDFPDWWMAVELCTPTPAPQRD